MNEKGHVKEKVKEPSVKNFYNIIGLIHNILLGVFLLVIVGVFLFPQVIPNIQNIFTHPNTPSNGVMVNPCPPSNNNQICTLNTNSGLYIDETITFFLLTFILFSFLYIIIGFSLFVLYLFNRTDKVKKTYAKKFLLRGIIEFIIVFIIYFAISYEASRYTGTIGNLTLPTFQ